MQAKTRQQIAFEYGVCTKTLKKWLKNAGVQLPVGLITPYYQTVIYELFGRPNESVKS